MVGLEIKMTNMLSIRPVLSEKSYASSEKLNSYVFVVPKSSNKLTVKAAVEKQFNVSVVSVNIFNYKGKAKRTLRKGGRPVVGKRVDEKRAYVVLAQGNSIPVFASLDSADNKSSAKKASKENK